MNLKELNSKKDVTFEGGSHVVHHTAGAANGREGGLGGGGPLTDPVIDDGLIGFVFRKESSEYPQNTHTYIYICIYS